jgi:glutamate 5-kinase
VVVKVGSRLLVEGVEGEPHRPWLAGLACDLAMLRGRGSQVVVVSSGAVALGRGRLGLPRRTLTLAQKQAAAAAGQSLLMRAWEEALAPLGLATAQVLLTPDDTEVRRRFVNARATLATLLACGAVPVVNENDTVATEEIRYGDNDRLAARVAQMAGADLLVLLSDVDGLYTADPSMDPTAAHIGRVERIDESVEALAGGPNARAGVGSGGMATKIAAARIAAHAGCATLVAAGSVDRPLSALDAGARHTWFAAAASPAAAYKAWIGGSLEPRGTICVDAGAAAALRRGKSLLAAGVSAVEGRFGKGDTVRVRDVAGREVGRGLSRYDAAEAIQIAGMRSSQIEQTLGYEGGPIIHADDLALGPPTGLEEPGAR